jgi:CDP-diacylglycerol--serine O-phosphatidyltransferase
VLFILCSALRLAKYNVESSAGVVHSTFRGLPTPASAGVLISFVLSYDLWMYFNAPDELFSKYNPVELSTLNFRTIPVLLNAMPKFFTAMPLVMLLLSFLMISAVPYLSFKGIRIERPAAMRVLVLVIILVILIVVFPQNVIFVIFSVYAASGLVMYIPYILHRRKEIPEEHHESC